jgi:hypothetical protein
LIDFGSKCWSLAGTLEGNPNWRPGWSEGERFTLRNGALVIREHKPAPADWGGPAGDAGGQHGGALIATRDLHRMSGRRTDEETASPLYADARNFYKVELWTNNEQRITDLLYAGNNLDKARDVFRQFIKKRPLAHLTIRQRSRVVDKWPKGVWGRYQSLSKEKAGTGSRRTATLLTWNVLLWPLTMPSAQLTVRLILAFLLLVAGLTVAIMPWNVKFYLAGRKWATSNTASDPRLKGMRSGFDLDDVI